MAEKPVQPNTQLVRAHARNLHISPRKMRLVTNLVKQMRVNDAITQLQFTNKKAAGMLIKVLQSASANAENNHSLNKDSLFVKEVTCDMGPVLKRSFPRARGSAFMIRRKMSHVHVTLEERVVKQKKAKKPTTAKITKKSSPIAKKATAPKKVQNPEHITKVELDETTVQTVHHENESGSVEQKTSPENSLK
jgi:large subunit ribosomal protein L22